MPSNHAEMLSVIVPVYNEAPTVTTSLSRLFEVLQDLPIPFEVIIVESNSTDGSRELVQALADKFPLSLLLQDKPEGKGSAVRMGLAKATGSIYLIFDADLEYDPNDIPRVLQPLLTFKTNFVLGSRHYHGEPIRSFGDHQILATLLNASHHFLTGCINILFHAKLNDPFTMYKAFRSDLFANTQLVSNGFDLDWELVLKGLRLGAKPIEVPVSYKARSFAEGKKIRFRRDGYRAIRALIVFRFCSL